MKASVNVFDPSCTLFIMYIMQISFHFNIFCKKIDFIALNPLSLTDSTVSSIPLNCAIH